MGLEAAKVLGKEQKIILVGRTVSKLMKYKCYFHFGFLFENGETQIF